VVRVDAEAIDMREQWKQLGMGLERSGHAGRDHRDPQSLRTSEAKLLDRLLWRVHRNHGGWGEHLRMRQPELCEQGIEAANRGEPDLLVGDRAERQTERGIDDREVDPDLVEPLRHQRRDHHGGLVVGVGWRRPPRAARQPLFARSLAGEEIRNRLPEPFDRAPPGNAFDGIEHHRHGLEQVAVRVDDRMIDPTADRLDLAPSRSQRTDPA
jgi:hypothetical protein